MASVALLPSVPQSSAEGSKGLCNSQLGGGMAGCLQALSAFSPWSHHGGSCGRALLPFAPVPAVVQSHPLCFTWTCNHLPCAPREHVLLYTSIFPTSVRHPRGSVLILPLQKTEILISPSIFEELRFRSP